MAVTPIVRPDYSVPDGNDDNVVAMASAERERYQRDASRIAGLSGMHPASRRVLIARAYREARDRIEALDRNDRQRRVARAAFADEHVWQAGFGTDVSAARSARDRAESYGDHEHERAGAAMREASAAGDDVLATAFGREAMRRASRAADGESSPWYSVGEAFLRSRDPDGARVPPPMHESQYATTPSALDAISRRAIPAREALIRAGHFRLRAPDGLPRNDWELDALARQDPTDAARLADRADHARRAAGYGR